MPALPPDQRPCKNAFALKLTGFDIEASPQLAFTSGDAVSLSAEKAVLDGDQINTEQRNSRTNIGFWDNPRESAHWLMRIRESGTYAVRGEFAAATGASSLRLTVDRKILEFDVPKTPGWDKAVQVEIGKISFPSPGMYHVILRPADPANWKPVNLWQIQMAPAG